MWVVEMKWRLHVLGKKVFLQRSFRVLPTLVIVKTRQYFRDTSNVRKVFMFQLFAAAYAACRLGVGMLWGGRLVGSLRYLRQSIVNKITKEHRVCPRIRTLLASGITSYYEQLYLTSRYQTNDCSLAFAHRLAESHVSRLQKSSVRIDFDST
jgi:hypothetical protein